MLCTPSLKQRNESNFVTDSVEWWMDILYRKINEGHISINIVLLTTEIAIAIYSLVCINFETTSKKLHVNSINIFDIVFFNVVSYFMKKGVFELDY